MDRPYPIDRRRFLAAGLAALGCGIPGPLMAEPTAGEKRPKPNLTPEQQALVKGQNDFAFEIYGKLNAGTDNQFFSPFSLSTALGLAAAGARGETAAEMTKVLHLPPAG